MANEILVKNGTPVVFADTTDYSSALSGYTRTAQILLETLANNAARQSDKVDLGATRARRYAIHVGIEIDVAPTAGTTISFFWSASASATAGTGNAAGASGADGAYKAGEEAEWLRQAIFLGSLVCTADAATTVQRACICEEFNPPERYGQIIVLNECGQALEGDSQEMYVALVPLKDEVQ